MFFEEKFEKILELYRKGHQEIHASEFTQGCGSLVYGLKMYKASNDNPDYIDIESEMYGICINKNETVKVQTSNGALLTDTLAVEAFLDNAIETLSSKGQVSMDKTRWLFPSGTPVYIKAPAASGDIKTVEVAPPDYGYCKGKSEAFDTLMKKKSITILE